MVSELGRLLVEYTFYDLASLDHRRVVRMGEAARVKFFDRYDSLYGQLVPYLSIPDLADRLHGAERKMFERVQERHEREWNEKIA